MFTNGLDRLFSSQEKAQRASQEQLVENCRVLAREVAVSVLENPTLGDQILADDKVTELIQAMVNLEVSFGDQVAIEQVLAMLPAVVRSHLEIIFIGNS